MRNIIFLISLTVFASGCASLNYTGYRQAVKVTSAKPGAEIRSQGELLGVTPSYVLIRRDRQPEITLNYPGQPSVRSSLQSHYRWWGSFAPNLLYGYVILSPVFMGIDFLTETAWDMDEAVHVNVPGTAPRPVHRPKVVAVAPTRASTIVESDTSARFLENYFAQKRVHKVAAYDETLGTFEDHNVRAVSRGEFKPSGELYARLNADLVVESALTYQKPGEVRYQMRDVLTNEVVESGLVAGPVVPDTMASRFRNFVLSGIPNAISLDSSAKAMTIEEKEGGTLSAAAEPLDGWGALSKFVGAFSVTSLLPPNSGSRVSWRLVSGVDLNFRQFRLFESKNATFQEQTFKHQRVVVGLGPQGYWQGALGVLYLSIVPGLSYSKIEWDGVNSGTEQDANINVFAELGYYQYISNHLVFRFFVRSVAEDRALWQEAVTRSQGAPYYLEGVNVTEVGIGLAYYFPAFGRRWRR